MELRDVEMGKIVAERVLILAPGGRVTARVGLPFTPDDHPLESWCPWQIAGLGSDRARAAIGVDSVQALSLAMQALGSTLYASDDYKAGRLKAFAGDESGADLGFPVHESFRDLLPEA